MRLALLSRSIMFFLGVALVATGCGSSKNVAESAFDSATSGLLGNLSKNLGISQDQAASGVGAIMGVAKNNLSASEWSQLAGGVPGTDQLLAAGSAGMKDLGQVADAAPMDIPGLGSLGQTAQLTSAFSKLGLSPAMISGFVPPTIDFVQKVGGPSASGLLKKGLGIL